MTFSEPQKAKAWRQASNLTQQDLANLTGYAKSAIYMFERGTNSLSKPHAAQAWKRYKLACLAVRVMLFQKAGGITSADRWNWT